MNRKTPLVLKVGGGEVDDPGFLMDLAAVVGSMDRPPVIVHGGGKEIGSWLEMLGQEAGFHQGLRITDERAVAVVEMVLSGRVNKRLVGVLVASGVEALGLSGRDLGLVRARKLEAEVDLGHVGEPEAVKAGILTRLCGMGIVPVISPVSQDAGGVVVPGVLDDGGEPIQSLTGEQIEHLIDRKVIDGGMLPKVRSSLETLKSGVRKVLITDLAGLRRYLEGKTAATLICP